MKQEAMKNNEDPSMKSTVETIKKQAEKSLNMIWVALGFGLLYWILEAIRDVLVFEKGDIVHEIFMPDFMSFWTRFLAVCILVLFGIYAQVLLRRIRSIQTHRIILSAAAFGAIYWILESLRDAMLQNTSFLERIFVPDSMSLWLRLLAVFVIVLLSLYVQNLSRDRNRIDSLLKKERDRLYISVERTMVDISKSNNYLRIENDELRLQQRSSEQAIKVFKAMFNANSVMLRQHKLSDILSGVCDSFVTIAGFLMVTVGFRKGDDGLDVLWMAKSAQDARNLEILDIERQEYELERWPIGQTLKTGIPRIIENFQDAQYVSNWSNSVMKAGLNGLICLPLKEHGHVSGTMNLFTSKDVEVNDLIIDHLKGFADQLAYKISEMRLSK